MSIYCFDLDNTLCETKNKKYFESTPLLDRIKIVNDLHEDGHYIKIYTARGMTEFNGNVSLVMQKYWEGTKKLLDSWGMKYDELILGKPSYDLFVDDKAIHSETYFKPKSINGIIIGAFDVIHPGYIKAFKEAKNNCTKLTVLLHEDPSKYNLNKIKPILSVEERIEILMSIRYVDNIISYDSEEELYNILKNNLEWMDIRFMGDDYIDKDYTGKNLNISPYILNRNHGWSATKYKKLIYEQFKK